MAQQARSLATRRRIIAAAIEVFSEIGYPATSLGDIIERAELTKGALYYHFDSKDALATSIIYEAGESILAKFRSITESQAPALENLIHGLFVTADFTGSDKAARIGLQMLRTFTGINGAAAHVYASWLDALVALVDRAGAEGDLRPDLDTKGAAHVILEAMAGAEAVSTATSAGTDMRLRVGRTLELLLPAIASDESLDYFREFLARAALRPTSG